MSAGSDLSTAMNAMGRRARDAAVLLRTAAPAQRTEALRSASTRLEAAAAEILDANQADVEAARSAGLAAPLVDRLTLNAAGVRGLAATVAMVADLPDPIGAEMSAWTRPNGLRIARVRTPIGVIAVIYESRPNVTADAAALCLRSGNAALLRCGSEALRTSMAIHRAMAEGVKAAGLPDACIQITPTADRAAVGAILGGLDGSIDLIVPRGGRSLLERVKAEARAPVLGHLEGLCHTFVHAAADPEMARRIVLNAKMRRVSVCGATETLLIDRQAPILSVRTVDGVEGAIAHIAAYGSGHTDAIVTEDAAAAARFQAEVDSAIVLWNASTQFADGGEFGFGAEIGIATDKLHARGPVGAEQLTTFKYVVQGSGQIRP
jgi:glutamate-5-semialdehyde dehydrogenase